MLPAVQNTSLVHDGVIMVLSTEDKVLWSEVSL